MSDESKTKVNRTQLLAKLADAAKTGDAECRINLEALRAEVANLSDEVALRKQQLLDSLPSKFRYARMTGCTIFKPLTWPDWSDGRTGGVIKQIVAFDVLRILNDIPGVVARIEIDSRENALVVDISQYKP